MRIRRAAACVTSTGHQFRKSIERCSNSVVSGERGRQYLTVLKTWLVAGCLAVLCDGVPGVRSKFGGSERQNDVVLRHAGSLKLQCDSALSTIALNPALPIYQIDVHQGAVYATLVPPDTQQEIVVEYRSKTSWRSISPYAYGIFAYSLSKFSIIER